MLRGGKVIAAVAEPDQQRERFPSGALRECFRQVSLSPSDVDLVAFAGKPRAEFDAALRQSPLSPSGFVKAMRPWLERRLHVVAALENTLGRGYRGRCVFVAGAADAREAAFTAWHDVLAYRRDDSAVDRAAGPTPSSYFSQASPGVSLRAAAKVLAWSAGLIIRRAEEATPRPRPRQDDTIPDEIYTLW
jgi:hypothetical protein